MAPPLWPAPQPGLPVGEAAGPGGVPCTLTSRGGRRGQLPHLEEPAAPEEAQLANCTTACLASPAPHSPCFLEPKGGPRSPTLGLAGRGRPGWETQGALQTGAPHTRPWGWLLNTEPLPSYPTMAQHTPDKAPHTYNDTCTHVVTCTGTHT